MNYRRIVFMLFLGILIFSPFQGSKAASNSGTISVSLTIEAYVKSTVENGIMTIMTNSQTPVVILENGEAMAERAVFGEFLHIKIKENSSYTIASEF